MAIVARRNLRTNSNDSVWSNNWTDTSIDYSATWPIGWSALYNAGTDKITVADNASLRVTTGSMQCLVKTTITWYGYLFCKNNNVNDNYYIHVWQAWAGKVWFYNWAWRAGNVTINDWLWHFVVLACSSSTTDIYIDGKLDTQLAYSMFVSTTAGASFFIWRRDFDGWLTAIWSMSYATFKNHRVWNAEQKNEWALIKWFF